MLMTSEEVLTIEQAAEMLRVHPDTIRRMITQGKLKASKVGRVYRIRKSEIERILG